MDTPTSLPTMVTDNSNQMLFRDHTEHPQYVCTYDNCGKKFGRKEHLARHMRARISRIHSSNVDLSEKPYKCVSKDCNEKFTRSDLLKRCVVIGLTDIRHIETKHAPPPSPGSSPKRHAFSDGSPVHKKPRTSNACRGCADSKVKCDGIAPVCGRCKRRERDCLWTRPKELRSPRLRAQDDDVKSEDESSPPEIERRNSGPLSGSMSSQPQLPIAEESIPTWSGNAYAAPSKPPPSQSLNYQNQPRPFVPALSFESTASSTSLSSFQTSYAPPQSAPPMPYQNGFSHQEQIHPQTLPSNDFTTFPQQSGNYVSNMQPGVYAQSSQQFSQTHFHYDPGFYSQSSAAPFPFDDSTAWAFDNQFDGPGQGMGEFEFNKSDTVLMPWNERLEMIVGEGFSLDQASSLSEDEPTTQEMFQEPGFLPGPSTTAAPNDANSTNGAKQEHVGYQNWDTDRGGAVADMAALNNPILLQLQENTRKLRATAHKSRHTQLVSSIKLTEDKRDDIKSMLDDTYAHSRLMYPAEHEPPRIPRLEFFNVLLKSYFHYFHDQHPILHLPSFLPQPGKANVLDGKKDILIYAMCCAGAFRHPARPLQEYATGMQELLRRTFNYHFDRNPKNVRDLESMQAWHLSIFIGGWSGKVRAIEISQSFCGAVDAMMRCGHEFDGGRGDWFEEEVKPVNPGEEQERWKQFVRREERKRLVYAQFWFECNLGVFMRTRPGMTFSELSLPLPCDPELWQAQTAEEWARLWNFKQGARLPRADSLLDLSATGLLRDFSKVYATIPPEKWAMGRGWGDIYVLLMGLHGQVLNISDNRTVMHESSRILNIEYQDTKAMLDYCDKCIRIAYGEHIKGRNETTVETITFKFNHFLLFSHLVGMMLHVPLRDVRMTNERNFLPTRKAAITRLWRTWKDNNGQQARIGLWHAGQIVRIARLVIPNDSAPIWIAPLVAEAANVMWSYAALIHYDDRHQRGGAFNGQHYLLDSNTEWDELPPLAREQGVPSIMNRNREILTLIHPPPIVTECAEILNQGPLGGKSKGSRGGKSILDEQFIKQLDNLVKYGNFEFLIDRVQETATTNTI